MNYLIKNAPKLLIYEHLNLISFTPVITKSLQITLLCILRTQKTLKISANYLLKLLLTFLVSLFSYN